MEDAKGRADKSDPAFHWVEEEGYGFPVYFKVVDGVRPPKSYSKHSVVENVVNKGQERWLYALLESLDQLMAAGVDIHFMLGAGTFPYALRLRKVVTGALLDLRPRASIKVPATAFP